MICAIMLLVLFPASSFGYTILKTFHQGQYGPGGLAYDELIDALWSSHLIEKKILKINPNNGSVLTTLYVNYNDLPTGLTYKDGYLWNSDQWAVPEVIHKVNPANGNSVDTIPGLGGLTFDHLGRLWSTDWYVELRALDPVDGTILDTIALPGFDPSGDDQIMGLAFDEGTQTLWVSVVEDRWNPPATNWLLNVALDGTVLSTEEFDPDPALDGYEIGGLAFDNNSGTLWANYSYFDRPPTFDDTYIYQLNPEPSDDPHIDRIRGTKEPGRIIRIIGQNFGDTQGDSVVH
ncbi:MAG: NHL repeat-containing protein, partial [Planctomycetota bacterium]